MPSFRSLKTSNYLTQDDCDPHLIVTIVGFEENVNVALDGQPPALKTILKFKDAKPLSLNYTNGQRIAAVTGKEMIEDWVGYSITLYRDEEVMMKGEKVGGIRVYVPQKQPPTAPQGEQSAQQSQGFHQPVQRDPIGHQPDPSPTYNPAPPLGAQGTPTGGQPNPNPNYNPNPDMPTGDIPF